ncbi:hypothetical protein [Deinococcus sp. NW-56]|uniref:hypothetical protein n=1 Tax=Deinococcus sp. NW-56 TaxID=2080419 RepID=UPI00131A0004|nr:hypothetical protein [Deinococcus sp. NW-56]
MTRPSPRRAARGVSAPTVHDSRTLMLEDLSRLLEHLPPGEAAPEALRPLVLDENVLGKGTVRTRAASLGYLRRLYPLEAALMHTPLFRELWQVPETRGSLALLLALDHDRLLTQSVPFVLSLTVGQPVTWPDLVRFLREEGTRYTETTLGSSARNLLSSWTQAGWLSRQVPKRRTRPPVTAEVVTLALLLGYRQGGRGLALLETPYAHVLDSSPETLDHMAFEASRRGWLTYRRIADVLEVTFPGLTEQRAGEGA